MFAGVLIPPRDVNIFELSLLLELRHNVVVLAVVLAAWGIYIITLLWARRKDRKDQQINVGVYMLLSSSNAVWLLFKARVPASRFYFSI